MKKNILKIILLLLLSFLFLNSAEAIGLVATPSQIDLSGFLGNIENREIIVENPSNQVALFDVYPDDFKTWIEMKPSSFILESGERKRVEISFKPKKLGIFKTNISVIAEPLSENSFKASGGIKIPLNVEVKKENNLASVLMSADNWNQVFPIIIIIPLLLIVLYFIFNKINKIKNKKYEE